MDKHVAVYAEVLEDGISQITKEMLGGGRQLADALGEELQVLLIGNAMKDAASEARTFGADTVNIVDDPKLAQYDTDLYLEVLATFVEQKKPRVLLFGHTDAGADLGPRLAFRLNTTTVTDCVELSIEPDTNKLICTKPVYGGLAMAEFISDYFPQIATVRPKSLTPAERNNSAHGEINTIDVDLSTLPSRVHFKERVTEEVEGIRLEDAEVIVSGGRGIGSPEGFQELEKFARLVKGTVGGSRVACDNAWVPNSLQIGLTGKIVAPRLYIAVGISGASQHMTGCSQSQHIIAINKDPAASIFKQAHFGVVDDWKVILPAFIDKLKAMG